MVDPSTLPRPLREFYELWLRKRGGRRFPARSDYLFEDLQPWLEELHLVEVLPNDFRYKVFATKSARRLGRELTGKLLSECGLSWMADDAGVDYRLCVTTGEPNFADRTARYVDGRLYSWKRLIVPLGTTDDAVDHLMISMEYHLI